MAGGGLAGGGAVIAGCGAGGAADVVAGLGAGFLAGVGVRFGGVFGAGSSAMATGLGIKAFSTSASAPLRPSGWVMTTGTDSG